MVKYNLMNVTIARKLRKTQSPPEELLWRFLRNHHLNGLSFRRQHPIGRYVVDFFCSEKSLIIEIDGDFHGEAAVSKNDAVRQAFLESEGYRVVRFAAREVMNNVNGVMQAIQIQCETSPNKPSEAIDEWGGDK